MKLHVSVIALLVVVAACQTAARGEGPRRQLGNREISALLKNGALLRTVPCVPNMPYPQEERFRADGSYTSYDDRADLSGRASVEDGMLCIEASGKRQCRKILRDTQGNYWQEQTYAPDVRIWSRKIEFLPEKTPLNCVK